MSENHDPDQLRQQSRRLLRDGNFREALEGFQKLCLMADNANAVSDLEGAVQCLMQLGEPDKLDDLLESVVEAHRQNWKLLQAAAAHYLQIPQEGFIIAGKFHRGGHRGGGEYASAADRDRARALQLLVEGMDRIPADAPANERGAFYLQLADCLLGSSIGVESWKLLTLTDLTRLPDYEKGWPRWRRWGAAGATGAPVDEQGQPIYHSLPPSWREALTDGQRWRWALWQAELADPSLKNTVRMRLAEFCDSQFGVHTMAPILWTRFRQQTVEPKESGTYALHTLSDEETIARLASGVRRFNLPDEFNPIKILQQIAAEPQTGLADQALEKLAVIFENRRQYPRAADYWRELMRRYGETPERKERLQQIVGNWCRLEGVPTQPAGQGAAVQVVFRNGKKLVFEAHEIQLEAWLRDLKAYLRSQPRELQWERTNPEAIGWLLINQNGNRYIGSRVAEWHMELTPSKNHFDKRVTVTTPLQRAGAYLLTARMEGGNQVRAIVWLADTALVQKPMPGRNLYYVADARSGAPIAQANLEFFGYRFDFPGGRPKIVTKNFAETSSTDGLAIVSAQQLNPDYQWMAIARTREGRLAFLGFSGIWPETPEPGYDAVKAFGISDRPVYRPGQPVHFKVWIARAEYGLQGTSEFAGRTVELQLYDPRGELLWKKQATLDQYGGLSGKYELPKDATLGVYHFAIHSEMNIHFQPLQFRVEEYKKPEFEVTVEAPDKPVLLGETITAKIRAKYYFGAPVSQGTVKYKVLRSEHSAAWFPVRPWDWCYGAGYWWFATDYTWYPGWKEWVGCRKPAAIWWPVPSAPPEVVAEAEVPIGSDGTVPVVIDTSWAKEWHGDVDHQYTIQAEVRDPSRRIISGSGTVLVARKPFTVFVWLDRGYARVGDSISANVKAQTVAGQPVKAQGKASLRKITYTEDKDRTPIETAVAEWDIATDEAGAAEWKIQASQKGQYRLVCQLTDSQGHTIEGGYIFTVVGEGFDGREFRFDSLELIPDRPEYAPGDRVRLQVNTDHAQGTVLLFVKPTAGLYNTPRLIRLAGKSTIVEIPVTRQDMPNFFVEAVTIFEGKLHTQIREIVVPPEKRILQVKATTDRTEYRPGDDGKIDIQITDMSGEAVQGAVVATVYDKAVEYISGGSNVPDIREYFWNWRRHHHPQQETNLHRTGMPLYKRGEPVMRPIGIFGATVPEEVGENLARRKSGVAFMELQEAAAPGAAAFAADGIAEARIRADKSAEPEAGAEAETPLVMPELRTDFADTALWVADLESTPQGAAHLELKFPQSLTTWKVRVWTISHGTRVGVAEAEVITRKRIMVRMQIPRFAIQGDEMTLSANVHNELDQTKVVTVSIRVPEDILELLDPVQTQCTVEPHGQARVDWRVRVRQEGVAKIQMYALTDVESDAMEMSLPCHVHGILKTESWAGTIRPDQQLARVEFRIPEERRLDQSAVEVRFSPTLALAMVDALPYLIEYPYGCTEQTLNRFLPAVLTQKVLLQLGLDLEQIQQKRTNLNPQETGDAGQRARQWQRSTANPVFDKRELDRVVRAGVERLTNMQNADGGWGWFSGWAESSHAHTTAQVVRGLLIAQANDVPMVPDVTQRGVEWLKRYEAEQVQRIANADGKKNPWKPHADDLDALVRHVLAEAGERNDAMRDFLYRDRNELSLYGKALFALSLARENQPSMLQMLIRNLSQYLVTDTENETAYLRLPNEGYWWFWYGDEIETQAAYLKLLCKTDPQSPTASRLVKYLLNNRKHATYWQSTRDTALCVEAFAEYLRATGEATPDMTVEVWLDGEKKKEISVNADNVFFFDNQWVLTGAHVSSGMHSLELRKKGQGPLYYNVYSTFFTLEDPIRSAGLEIKVQRKYYRLLPVDARTDVSGQQGRPVQQRIEKYQRLPLSEGDSLASGDLIEVELELESKNDYEYVMFEDMKAAGLEPVEVRSGYLTEGLLAYMELRDDRVALFVRELPRGRHSLSYRLRAEIPGRFSALPTQARAMYAPELRANSDEQKIHIVDRP